ncbi:MAG: cation transporter [Candidatus Thiodiazotropha sp.]|jgi:hypothetical protein
MGTSINRTFQADFLFAFGMILLGMYASDKACATEMKHVEISNTFSRPFRTLLVEFSERAMTIDEMRLILRRIAMSGGRHRKKHAEQELERIEQDLEKAERSGLVRFDGERYALTDEGLRHSEIIEQQIKASIGRFLLPNTAALIAIVVNALLSIVKLGIGFIAGSAGLVADGIDNSVDVIAAGLVWLGIKFNREKAASLFILATMLVSVFGIGMATIDKLVDPRPVQEGGTAILVALLCGITMFALSTYHYVVGWRHGNMALLCQAVDARNHVWTSGLVTFGIILSLIADRTGANWLYYGDAIASGFIGLLILKGVIELAKELFASEGDVDIPHFVRVTARSIQSRIIDQWIMDQLVETSLTYDELEARFKLFFCGKPLRILSITGMSYQPRSTSDLKPRLEVLISRRLVLYDQELYVRSST